ncbi:NAD(P)H-binding protein [Agromyces intestinalis]|uniref:NAD(P)H-binding protein n=1 Tax=Agromyces intestinalis TaxID=2592652 RepID=A0A5C1YEE8_9MICO|nr:NmrA family NAD(P)-binding protein [Agromyces intestinalis]QEO13890.1 NAD(P)H-binding protein [Agromyces intestinalis]
MTVLVTGATGNIGPHVVEALVAQGTPTRVISRDAARARGILPDAVDVVEGDLYAGAVDAALDGVDAVFLLTPHAFDMADLQLRIIREVRRSGVKLVKLSGTDSAIRPDGPQALRQHWEIETVLQGSGQPFVTLRANAFMQTMIGQIMLPAIRATGRIPNPLADAGLAMIDGADVGAVAARVLTDDTWDGSTLVLTGPRAVAYREIAERIGEIRGSAIEVVEVTPADVRAGMLARGMEPWEAEHFEEVYQVFRDHGAEVVTDTVEVVTGRPAGTVEAYLDRNAAFFREPGAAA